MNDHLKFSFEFAISSMIIANTPLFLVNELRKSTDVQRAAASIDPSKLKYLLKSSIKRDPKTTRSEVAPYLYIVMAGIQGNNKLLNEVKELDTGNHKWLSRILDYVTKTTSSVSSQRIDLAGMQTASGRTSTAGNLPNNYNNIDIGSAR